MTIGATVDHDEYGKEKAAELVNRAVEIRKEEMFSLRDVQKSMGLKSHTTIASMEQGKTMPRLDNFIKLLSVYGKTLKIVDK